VPGMPQLVIASEQRARPVSNWSRGLRRFVANRRAVVGAVTLFLIVSCTVLAPVVVPYDPNAVDLANMLQPPGPAHIFGTDNVGRDYLARTLHGGRVSVAVGSIAMLISIGLGMLVGGTAGYFGGVVDEVLSRFVDFVLSLPIFFIMLVVVMLWQPTILNVILLIGLSSWMPVARLVRAVLMAEREKDYVTAAVAAGAGVPRTMLHHLIPNIIGPVIVSATFNVGDAILLESALSFLGLGVQPPQATWGNMVIGAQQYLYNAPWIAIFPGLMIVLTVMSFSFVGDGLRDAFDTQMLERW